MTQPAPPNANSAAGSRFLLYSMVALFVAFNAAILVRTIRKEKSPADLPATKSVTPLTNVPASTTNRLDAVPQTR